MLTFLFLLAKSCLFLEGALYQAIALVRSQPLVAREELLDARHRTVHRHAVQKPAWRRPRVVVADVDVGERWEHGQHVHVEDVRHLSLKLPSLQPDLATRLPTLLPSVEDDVDAGICAGAADISGAHSDDVGHTYGATRCPCFEWFSSAVYDYTDYNLYTFGTARYLCVSYSVLWMIMQGMYTPLGQQDTSVFVIQCCEWLCSVRVCIHLWNSNTRVSLILLSLNIPGITKYVHLWDSKIPVFVSLCCEYCARCIYTFGTARHECLLFSVVYGYTSNVHLWNSKTQASVLLCYVRYILYTFETTRHQCLLFSVAYDYVQYIHLYNSETPVLFSAVYSLLCTVKHQCYSLLCVWSCRLYTPLGWQFVPNNMSTQHPKTWSPTSPSLGWQDTSTGDSFWGNSPLL